jgi:hypothetical protein
MATHYLARRGNWQLVAHQGGAATENDTVTVIKEYLESKYPGWYTVTSHPTELRQLYYEYTYELDPTMYVKPAQPTAADVWYDTEKGYFATIKKNGKEGFADGGGCIPDVKIEHRASARKCFLECKNQADAGNAHERAAKYATPSVIGFVQKKLGVNYHPFGYIFTGAIVETRKYVVELATTFGFAPNHLFLWKKERPVEPLIEWLEAVILPPLRGAGATEPAA